MEQAHKTPFVDVAEAGRSLGVSVSTVWRMIRRGDLPSVRKGGRRWIPREALATGARNGTEVPPLRSDHPIFRLVGAGRGGGNKPGARDKHAILDEWEEPFSGIQTPSWLAWEQVHEVTDALI